MSETVSYPPWVRKLMFWRRDCPKAKLKDQERTEKQGYSSYESSRGWSFLMFSWLRKWINAVAYEGLDFHRYPGVPCSDFDSFTATELSLYLKEYRDNPRGPMFQKVVGNMRMAAVRVFRHSFAYLLGLTFLKDVLEIANIYLLKDALRKAVLGNTSAVISYLLFSLLLLMFIFLDSFVDAYQGFYHRRLSLRIEMTLHMMLFGKILSKDKPQEELEPQAPVVEDKPGRLKRAFSRKSSEPKDDKAYLEDASILNLALFDVHEASKGLVRMIDLVNAPMKIMFLGFWLYHEIGPVSLRAVLLIVISTIIMVLCECECAVLLKDYVSQVDLRLFKTQVVLEELREIRLVKWLGYAMKSVITSRTHELQICLKRAYLGSISVWVGMASPYIMNMLILCMAAKTDSPVLRGMNLEKSFSIPLLHALNYFIHPFRKLPSDINDHLETSLSCLRLEEFIYKKNLDVHIPTPYDKRTVRVAEPNMGCQHPYQVDESLFTSNGRNIWSILLKKFRTRLPKWMLCRKSQEPEPQLSRAQTLMDAPKWAMVSSNNSVNQECEVPRESYMGVSYPYVVKMTFASFKSSSRMLLSNISLTLYPNQVCLITGPSGSGKSCLLNAVLGHYQLVSGSCCVVPLEVNLPIGYVSQEPWIQVGSVRECILFGHQLDANLYNAVVTAVGLDVDFNAWELGDLRVIDEGGQNLSTGQRMRISIARCIYNQMMHANNVHAANYTLYCLDDMFSVLDPTLSVKIFNALFGEEGMLRGSCVMMVIQNDFIDMMRYHGVSLDGMEFSVYHMRNSILDPYGEKIQNFMDRCPYNPPAEGSPEPLPLEASPTSVVADESQPTEETDLNDTEQDMGAVKFRSYVWLFNNAGIFLVVLTVFVSLVSVLVSITNDQIIRSWANVVDQTRSSDAELSYRIRSDEVMLITEDYDDTMQTKIKHFHLLIFIITIKVVLCLCTCILETLGTMQAAKRSFESAIEGVLRSPISVFNTLRIGVINNRLATDQSYIDYNVFNRFSHIAAVVIYCVMSITALCVLNWWSGLAMPFVLFLIYILTFRNYLPMRRSVSLSIF